MSGKEKLLLEKRLLAYSLTAGAVLAGSNSLDAQVQTTDVNPDAIIGASTFYTIDLEGGLHGTGAVSDYDILLFFYSGANTAFYIRAQSANGTDFLGNKPASFFPYVLTANADIPVTPATGQWGNLNTVHPLGVLNDGNTRGYWLNTTLNRFVGIRFTSEDDGQIHYGFVELTVDFTNKQMTIHKYGYETTANTGITQALPVELTSFTALRNDNSIQLKWETATEVNNYGFEIERQQSENGTQNTEWETIGFVQGHGNSNSPKNYEFTDVNPFGETPPSGDLKYRLKQIDTDGTFTYYGIIAEVSGSITSVDENQLPTEFSLSQNYPNPFNPTTTINFSVPVVAPRGVEVQNVSLKIYDILGTEIATLVNEQKSPGNYSVEFDAGKLPSGVYIYKIAIDNFNAAKKMTLIK